MTTTNGTMLRGAVNSAIAKVRNNPAVTPEVFADVVKYGVATFEGHKHYRNKVRCACYIVMDAVPTMSPEAKRSMWERIGTMYIGKVVNKRTAQGKLDALLDGR